MMMMTTSIFDNEVYLVVPAAGSSTRMGGGRKQYMSLAQGTVLSQCVLSIVTALRKLPLNLVIRAVSIAYSFSEDGRDAKRALYADPAIEDLLKGIEVLFVAGGATRQESVCNALMSIKEHSFPISPSTIVLVHDAARPFVSEKVVKDVLKAAIKCGSAVPAIPVTDTIVEGQYGLNEGKCLQITRIAHHLERGRLLALQTPQAFRFEALLDAHKKASNDGVNYTDDSELYDKYEENETMIVQGDVDNKKITFISDMPCSPSRLTRIGLGHDSHRLVEGRPLMLGGVEIPFEKGEAAHSDGDALLHAVIDSLLGAAHMGDIGEMFPPKDDKWLNAKSLDLLDTAWQKVRALGWALVNMDCVVRLEKPALLPHRAQIVHTMASALGVADECISLSAKTGEGLGSVGLGEAVEAWVICLLSPSNLGAL